MGIEQHIEKIEFDSLSEKEKAIYKELDDKPFGIKLAMAVAQKLNIPKYKGWGLFHSHRDYCGLGLFFYQKRYILSEVFDGYGPHSVVASFHTASDFIEWLASENNRSMALYGEKFNNQTITRLRLEWFLEDGYSPVWNDYCRYTRDRNPI